MKKDLPIILAITAASGIIHGIRILEFLLEKGYKTELIISSNAYYIAKHELGLDLEHDREKIRKGLGINSENLKIWLDNELYASLSSGSYLTRGMIIAPASMAMVAAIAHGLAENLITRAADVCIKERRPLTIVPRETPLSSIHLENMLKLSNLGVNIVPPITGYYTGIKTLENSLDFVTGKILDAHKIENNLYERWQL